MTDLWFVRHGQTDWNLTGRWQGQSASAPGLNKKGMEQARVLCNALKNENFAAIYSSDLQRSIQTVEPLATTLGLTVQLEPRLREMNLGSWEGMLVENIHTQYPDAIKARNANPFQVRAPDGESPEDVAKRAITALKDIATRHPNESVLIVSHGLVLAVIYCHMQGIPMDQVYEHIPENAKPYHIEWKPE